MQKHIISTGLILSAVSVILGAFGAHAFKAILVATERLSTYETAVEYQFYHSLGLILIGLLAEKLESSLLFKSAIFMIAGIVIFSGSLYLLCLTEIKQLGAITPVGGLCFIAAWVMASIAVMRK